MNPMICFECGRLAEQPFKTLRWSVGDTETEKIVCEECYPCMNRCTVCHGTLASVAI
jgi:hypothetical protein